MKNSLLYIELPPPVHGITYINQIIYEGVKDDNQFKIIETNYTGAIDDVSKFKIGKVIRNVKIAIQCWKAFYKFTPPKVYIVLSATLGGIIRELLILLPAIIRGKEKLLHLHGFTYSKIYKENRLYRFIFDVLKRKSKIIVLGNAHKRDVDLTFKIDSVILKNCIRTVPSPATKNLSIGNKKIKLLYISNISESKGTFDLIKAIKNIPSFQLTIAGGIWEDEEQFSNLLAQATNVEYIGFANELKKTELFGSHQIFCLPSKLEEGSPISIIEAMSYSMPVLASNKGCIPEMINSCGYILKDEDRINDIQNGINYIISNYNNLSHSAYQTFITNYSKDVFISDLKALLS